MGGNAQIFDKAKGKIIQADKIPLKLIGRSNFTKTFVKVFKEINKQFKKKTGHPIWVNEKNIETGVQFNGSTSYIFDASIPDNELVKYKSHAGDLDLIVPKEMKQEIWDFFKTIEGKEIIKGVEYMGPSTDKLTFSAIGETLIVLFKAQFGKNEIIAQVDLELLDVDDKGTPSDWSRFSHSSSFEDAKVGIKALHHKYLIQAIVGGASVREDIVIATPASTPEKIRLKKVKPNDLPRMLKFSVVRGIRKAYDPMHDAEGKSVFVDGKQVYQERDSKTDSYETIVGEIFKLTFGRLEEHPEDQKDFGSFVGVANLMKKYLDKTQIKRSFERYEQKLFGKYEQVLERNDPKGDYEVKISGYNYLAKKFGFKVNQKKIDDYYANFKGERNESMIRNAMRGLV